VIRQPHSSRPGGGLSPRRVLTLAVGGLLILSVLPAWMLAPIGGLSRVAGFALEPEQAAINWLLRGLRTASGGERESEELRKAHEEAELFKGKYYTELTDNARLRERISQIEGTLALTPGLNIEAKTASVIGLSDGNSRLVSIKAGRDVGVTAVTSVATVRGTQLLGRVVDVDALSCRVLLIDDQSTPAFDALLMAPISATGEQAASGTAPSAPFDALEEGIACNLKPIGNGLLAGNVKIIRPSERVAGGGGTGGGTGGSGRAPKAAAPQPKEQMVVRLRDDRWPALAQMLVVGVVERIEYRDLGHVYVIVRPAYGDLRALGEVVLRLPAATTNSRTGASGGGGGS